MWTHWPGLKLNWLSLSSAVRLSHAHTSIVREICSDWQAAVMAVLHIVWPWSHWYNRRSRPCTGRRTGRSVAVVWEKHAWGGQNKKLRGMLTVNGHCNFFVGATGGRWMGLALRKNVRGKVKNEDDANFFPCVTRTCGSPLKTLKVSIFGFVSSMERLYCVVSASV